MESGKQYELNKNLAQMLKGGVIMDVTTPEQAKIAEEAGASTYSVLIVVRERGQIVVPFAQDS